MPTEHQFEQFRDRFGVLLYLRLGSRVEDGEAGVDVPFVRVDPQHQIGLDVLDAAHVPLVFPGELVVGTPRRAHAQERRMGHGLRVGGDTVVFQRGEVDLRRSKAGEDAFNEFEALLRCAVFDNDQRLASGVNFGAVQ